MVNNANVSPVPNKASIFAKGLMIALTVVVAAAISTLWAPSAYAAESSTYTQTELGYQVIPIDLKAGAVKLDFAAGASSADVYVYANVDSDGNATGRVVSVYASDPYAKGSKYGNVAKSGTYYLVFYASTYSGATGSTATVTQYPYKKVKSATLNKSTLGTGCGDNGTIAYYKVSVKKRGYITLKVKDVTGVDYSSSVWLCNSKKKSLSGSDYSYVSADKSVYYGVKKGTYYIAVKSYASLYSVQPKFTAVKQAVKAKKSKAVSIKKGKVMKVVMAAGEKTAWFKFKVTKKKAYKISLTGKIYDGIKLTFSGKGYYDTSKYLYSGDSSDSFKTEKLKPQTYYVQVTRSGNGNGYYTIKWK